MNPITRNGIAGGSGPGGYEETLRLLAGLPAPAGLEERVQARLVVAPRQARILSWPSALRPGLGWAQGSLARSAAAAAIVCVVLGGGWGVYSRVQPAQSEQGIVLPHVAAPGGFAGAGAMRTPQTLNGPVAPPATQAAVPSKDALHKAQAPVRRAKAATKAGVAAVAPAAK
jgi:hypothetical protein